MDPSTYVVQVSPEGAVQDNLEYYLSCEGTNPASPYVTDAKEYSTLLNNTLAVLTSTTCPGNADLISLYSTTASIDTSIDHILSLLKCPPIRFELQDLLFNSLCDDTFLGLYILWICQYSTVLFLFLLCIVGSIIHNFFGAFWYVSERDPAIYAQSSERQKAVEKALRTRQSNDLEGSDDDDDEEEEFHHRSPEPVSRSMSEGVHQRSNSRFMPLEVGYASTQSI